MSPLQQLRVRRPRAPRDGGSATIELVVLAPVLLILIALTVAGARIRLAETSVDQAAGQAARAASLARTASQARNDAEATARQVLSRQGLTCATSSVSVTTSGFRAAAGQEATVSATVTCMVPLGDLAIPGLPGTRRVEATAFSSLDTYRGRG